MAKHTASRYGESHPVTEARTQNMFCRLSTCSSTQNEGTAFYWTSPTVHAKGVIAFARLFFHTLGLHFKITAQKSQRSWQGFSPLS